MLDFVGVRVRTVAKRADARLGGHATDHYDASQLHRARARSVSKDQLRPLGQRPPAQWKRGPHSRWASRANSFHRFEDGQTHRHTSTGNEEQPLLSLAFLSVPRRVGGWV